jgi:hypothetical protein
MLTTKGLWTHANDNEHTLRAHGTNTRYRHSKHHQGRRRECRTTGTRIPACKRSCTLVKVQSDNNMPTRGEFCIVVELGEVLGKNL